MPQNCKRNKVEHTIINKFNDRPHFPKKKMLERSLKIVWEKKLTEKRRKERTKTA